MVLATNAKNSMNKICEQRGSLMEQQENLYIQSEKTDEILGIRNEEKCT